MVSRGRVSLLGAAVAVMASLLIATSAQAASTYYASPSGSGSCSESSPCSLADAISGAGNGDTVELEGGLYTLAHGDGIVLNDDITLMGAPGASAVLDGSLLVNQQIARANDGATVEDLTFQNSINALVAAGGLTTVTDSTFAGDNDGLDVLYGADADVSDSTFTGNGTADIDTGGTTTVTSSTLINSGTGGGYVFYGGGAINAGADIMVAGSGLQICSNSGTLTDLGYNIATDNTCALTGTGSVSNSTTLAGSLGTLSGSGETQIVPLEAGSPALRLVSGPLSGGTAICGTADQLGNVRPTGSCDAGAYEVSTGNTTTPTGTGTGTTTTTTPVKPSISAALSSAHAETRYGWYRSPVTVTFSCDANGATLSAACPAAVTLSSNGAGQSVTRTITTTAGASATSTSSAINIDTTKPKVAAGAIKNHAVYRHKVPKLRCVAHDSLSGVASCTVKLSSRHSPGGRTVRYKLTATDKAGNVAVASGSYKVA